MVHVPYRGGGPAVTDLIGGQVQVFFPPTPPSIEHIRSGKLRALAVTSARRSQALPDIATVSDFVPGYEASQWYGIGAPRDTPVEIIDMLNKEINAIGFVGPLPIIAPAVLLSGSRALRYPKGNQFSG
jgi:tripartite-type tricarboxylate transporter receptor subunit TctC